MRLRKNKKGQGLVEVIIALGIITTGIVGVLTLTYSSLSASETSIKQIIAANLAREGVEVVRSIRDSNWLSDDPNWLAGLISGVDYNGTAQFDPSVTSWTIDLTLGDIYDVGTELYRDVNGVYTHDNSGIYSGYRRFLDMSLICGQQNNHTAIRLESTGSTCPGGYDIIGLKVVSEVVWQEKSGDKSFLVEENIYDWHDAR